MIKDINDYLLRVGKDNKEFYDKMNSNIWQGLYGNLKSNMFLIFILNVIFVYCIHLDENFIIITALFDLISVLYILLEVYVVYKLKVDLNKYFKFVEKNVNEEISNYNSTMKTNINLIKVNSKGVIEDMEM